MNESKVIDFTAIETPKQADDIIKALTDYKLKLVNESAKNLRKGVEEHVNEFMRFCEAGDRIVYLFIPEKAIKSRVTFTVDGVEGYLFSLDSDTLEKTIIDDTNNIVCVMSELH